jgi:hypothetical protein
VNTVTANATFTAAEPTDIQYGHLQVNTGVIFIAGSDITVGHLIIQAGGELNKIGQFKRATTMHKKCKEDCGCQHKTGPEVGSLAFAMAEPMRTQYPLE